MILHTKRSLIKSLALNTLIFSSVSFISIGVISLSHAAEPALNEDALNTLSLKQTIQLFELNNRELLSAKRNVEGALADTTIAGQNPNPVASVGISSLNLNLNQGNNNAQHGSSNSLSNKTVMSVLQLSQLFERGNKRDLRLVSANEAFKASQFDYKDTVRQQQLVLLTAYYDLLLAQEAEKIQGLNVDLYGKSLSSAEFRLKAGDVSASDVARIKVDTLRSQNDLRQALANKQKAQATLAYLIGKENNANEINVAETWPSIDAVNHLNPLNLVNIDNRPDVLAADLRTKQADDLRKLANSLKTRDVTVSLAYQHFPGQEPGVGVNTIGATLSFPLFTNYQYQGEIGRAEVNYNLAQDLKEQTKAFATGELTKAKADLNSAIDRVQRFDEQTLGQAQKVADAAEFAYKNGAIDVTDLLDARRTLRATQLDAAISHADFAKSLAAWHAATQIEKTND